MKKQNIKLMLASVPALAMSMVVGTAYGECDSVTVKSYIDSNQLTHSTCTCKTAVNGEISDTGMKGAGSTFTSMSLNNSLYCNPSTATTCFNNFISGANRSSGKYTFESTSGKSRFTCKWDQANIKWVSGCKGATCNP